MTDATPVDSASSDDGHHGLLEDHIERLATSRGDVVGGVVEQDLTSELAGAGRALHDADRFSVAHRTFARGLEVLWRNGPRPPALPKTLGPVRPVARLWIQFVTGWIVRSQLRMLVDRVGRLYKLREANAVPGTEDYRVLRRARMQMQALADDLGRTSRGVPTFLVGGAFVSILFSALQELIRPALEGWVLEVALAATTAVVMLGGAWLVLLAAGIARRRIRLSIGVSLRELYVAIGDAGHPPRDRSYAFAVAGLVFFAVAAIVIPSVVVILLGT